MDPFLRFVQGMGLCPAFCCCQCSTSFCEFVCLFIPNDVTVAWQPHNLHFVLWVHIDEGGYLFVEMARIQIQLSSAGFGVEDRVDCRHVIYKGVNLFYLWVLGGGTPRGDPAA